MDTALAEENTCFLLSSGDPRIDNGGLLADSTFVSQNWYPPNIKPFISLYHIKLRFSTLPVVFLKLPPYFSRGRLLGYEKTALSSYRKVGAFITSACFRIVSRETTDGKRHSVPLPCAPESPAEPAGFILRTLRPHVGDQAGSTPCSGSSDPHSAQAREDSEAVFDTEPRVPSIPAKRSHPKNSHPILPSPRPGPLPNS